MKSTVVGFTFFLFGTLTIGCAIAQAQSATFSGRVHQVWEDGFQLNSSGRSITVDSYDICGDNTTRHITVGEKVTVTGEFEGREFDAFSITNANLESVCR
jgi:hypothetical protein